MRNILLTAETALPINLTAIVFVDPFVAKSIGVHEITLGKWVNKAKGGDSGRGKELSETERAELERLRKENKVLRMERDFAKKVAAWFAKEQP